MNSSQPVLASLPYYDLDIENAQLKARVEAEIARELKRTPKLASDPRVPPDFELFKVGNDHFLSWAEVLSLPNIGEQLTETHAICIGQ